MAAILPGNPITAARLPGRSVVPSAEAAPSPQSSLLNGSVRGSSALLHRCSSPPAEYCLVPVRFTCRPHTVLQSINYNGTATRVRSVARNEAEGQSSLNSSTVAPADDASVPGLTARSHLDMLERYSDKSNPASTISEQLARVYDSDSSDDDSEVSIPLSNVEKLERPPLTIHQKRNIRRQNYLNQVSQRNDAPFFTAVALSILLPPACILAVAIATGYVEVFP